MDQTPNNHPALASLESRLETIAKPIRHHWAKHFPIHVIRDKDVGIAAIDFQRIYVHPNAARFDDSMLFCILAHEWAHRMVSPKSGAIRQRIVNEVASALNVTEAVATVVSEPAIELIVDRSNAEIADWAEAYVRGFVSSFNRIVKEEEQAHSGKVGHDRHLLDFNRMLLALRLTNISEDRLPDWIQAHESQARLMVSELFSDWTGWCDDAADPDHVGKIVRFSKRFYQWIPKQLLASSANLLSYLPAILMRLDMLMPLMDGGVLPAPNFDTFPLIREEGSESDALEFDLSLTRQVTDHLLSEAREFRKRVGVWQLGQSFSALDLKRSARTYNKLIPGITTRQRSNSSRVGKRNGTEQLRMCLVVDDSASMNGREALFARSLCEGVNRFAAHRGFHIGLITFGSEVDIAISPGQRYDRIRHQLQRLDGNLGFTCLKAPMRKLISMLENDSEISHAMLITDAMFSDIEECRGLFERVLEGIRMTVIMVNTDFPEGVRESFERYADRITFLKVDPSDPPVQAILKEVF